MFGFKVAWMKFIMQTELTKTTTSSYFTLQTELRDKIEEKLSIQQKQTENQTKKGLLRFPMSAPPNWKLNMPITTTYKTKHS